MKFEAFRAHYPKTTFRLGITMAGAVSAGAYSAGVICYLMQTLEKWEQEKMGNYDILHEVAQELFDPEHDKLDTVWIAEHQAQLEQEARKNKRYDASIPMHDVILEVLGGASAGSLVAAIAVLSLTKSQPEVDAGKLFDKTVRDPERKRSKADDIAEDLLRDNFLYDSWVNLNTGMPAGGGIMPDEFDQLLAVDKTEELRSPFALLNPSLLEKIKDYQVNRVYETDHDDGTLLLPGYVSPNLKTYFSLTSLRGVKFGIKFSGPQKEDAGSRATPAHLMRVHSGMAVFQMGNLAKTDGILPLDLSKKSDAQLLVETAIASGAFPIGLPPRKISLQPAYVKAYIQRVLKGINLDFIDLRLDPDENFELAAVDGGTLNNEPFIEVCEELLQRTAPDRTTLQDEYPALMLIDPFPNFEQEEEFKYPKSLSEIASGIIGALRGQAMIKDPQTILAAIDDDLHLGMIFPSRRNAEWEIERPALATGALEGFAGFLDKQFRLHDFHLGMKNCQSFIRQYFHIKERDKGNYRCFQDWKAEQDKFNAFAVEREGELFFPIIPDVTVANRTSYEEDMMKERIGVVPFPKISAKGIADHGKPIYRRLRFLVYRLLRKPPAAEPKEKISDLSGPFTVSNGLKLLGMLTLITIFGLLFVFLPGPVLWSILYLLVLIAAIAYFFGLTTITHNIVKVIQNELRNAKQLKQ